MARPFINIFQMPGKQRSGSSTPSRQATPNTKPAEKVPFYAQKWFIFVSLAIFAVAVVFSVFTFKNDPSVHGHPENAPKGKFNFLCTLNIDLCAAVLVAVAYFSNKMIGH